MTVKTHGSRTGYTRGCRCLECWTTWRRNKKGLPDGDPRHGTLNAYANYNCRCEACRVANAEACATRKVERSVRGLEPGDPRHGTANGYGNWGCRCIPCTEARRLETRERRARKKVQG